MSTPARMRPEDFDTSTVIAKGSFGTVYKAVRKVDGRVFALKQVSLLDMKKVDREEAIDEARMLSQLSHPHITKHYESFIDKDNKLNIFMEFASKGNLSTLIKSYGGKGIPEDLAWKVFIQAMLGLSYIHSKKIIHRDIKSLNIFIDSNDNIKIGDLGIARALSNNSNFARTIVGTPLYLSPEVCEEKPYNEKSDVWAMGVVLYECCMGHYPFEAQNEGALLRKILRGQFAPVSGPTSAAMVQMVNMCMTFKPDKRPDTFAILRHPVVVAKAKALRIDMTPRHGEEDEPVYSSPRQPAPSQPLEYVQQQQMPSPGYGVPRQFGHQQHEQPQQYGQVHTQGPYIDPLYGELPQRPRPGAIAGHPFASVGNHDHGSDACGVHRQDPQLFGPPGGAYVQSAQRQYRQQPGGVPADHPFASPPRGMNDFNAMADEISQIQRQQQGLYQQQAGRPAAGGHPAQRVEAQDVFAHPTAATPPNQRQRPEELRAAGAKLNRPHSGSPFALHHGGGDIAFAAAATERREQEAAAWGTRPAAPQYARRRAPDLQITGPSLRGNGVASATANRSAPRAADDATSYVSSYATSYYC